MTPSLLREPTNTMVRFFVLALAFLCLVWVDVVVVTHAEDPVQPTAPQAEPAVRPDPQSHNHGFTIDERVKRLAESLALTPTQESQMTVILTRRQAALERLRLNTSLSAVDRVHRHRAVDEQTVDQIKNVLSAEQRRKFTARETLRPESYAGVPSPQRLPTGESTP